MPEERHLKHNDFNSLRKAKNRLKFNFPSKEKIIELLVSVEKKRDHLCYGKRRPQKELEELLQLFNQLKEIIEEEGILNEV